MSPEPSRQPEKQETVVPPDSDLCPFFMGAPMLSKLLLPGEYYLEFPPGGMDQEGDSSAPSRGLQHQCAFSSAGPLVASVPAP